MGSTGASGVEGPRAEVGPSGSLGPSVEVPVPFDPVDPDDQARVYEALFGEPPPAEHLGRYAVLGTLGRGAMGTVYEAFDRSLDRRVALKVLHNHLGEQQRGRLEREALALAKLSHPNVVQVYEVGESEGRAFIAMELVQGSSLREWMGREPQPGWRECVDVFVQAGRGLAAAHARGLIHRDFKPDNVLVGTDDRVRVADFGLARPAEFPSHDDLKTTLEQPSARRSGDDSRSEGQAPMTKTGAVLGTIAYMPLEQLRGRVIDARADQFSFCVAFHEAVYAERPYGALSPGQRLLALERPPAEPEMLGRAPRWLYRALRRGLACDPEDRFGSMDALLAALDRSRTRRRWALAGTLAVAVAAGSSGAVVAQSDPCEIDDGVLAGTWDDGRRESMRIALGGTPADTVERALDEWGARWLGAQRSVCEATRVHGIESDAMLDLRTGCLARQRREAGVLVELLARTDPHDASQAADLVARLPDASVCEDPRLAETSHPLPRDADQREAVLTAYEDLARARAAQHGRGARERLERLEPVVERLDHLPLGLELRVAIGERLLRRQESEQGVRVLRSVIREAEIEGLDELSATARVRLSIFDERTSIDPETRQVMLDEAEISVDRLGRTDDRRRLQLRLSRASVLDALGEHVAALQASEAIVETASSLGLVVIVARAEFKAAGLLQRLGRSDEALAAYQRARSIYEQQWGPRSLFIADIEQNSALLELSRGRPDQAMQHIASARELHGFAAADDVSSLATLDLYEAKIALSRGELDVAAKVYADVLARDCEPGPRADAWTGIGVVRFYQGDHPGSVLAYREAIAVRLEIYGPGHHTVGVLHSNIGESLAAQGDHQGALDAYARALGVLEPTLPRDHRDLAFPTKGRGGSRLALGDIAGAIVDLRRARELHEANPGEPREHADVEFTLARALAAGGERSSAIGAARAAHRRLLEVENNAAAADVEAWLNEQQRNRP